MMLCFEDDEDDDADAGIADLLSSTNGKAKAQWLGGGYGLSECDSHELVHL